MNTRRWSLMASIASLMCHRAYAQGDAAAGKTVFENQCSNCHTAVVGKNGFGPSLAGVLERRSGGLPGYKYSDAMTNAGITWNAVTLDEFLASSTVKVPGTLMAVAITDVWSKVTSLPRGSVCMIVFG